MDKSCTRSQRLEGERRRCENKFLWMKILHVVASDWYPEESSWPITLEIEKKQAISFNYVDLILLVRQ